jgi:hypothetical protein
METSTGLHVDVPKVKALIPHLQLIRQPVDLAKLLASKEVKDMFDNLEPRSQFILVIQLQKEKQLYYRLFSLGPEAVALNQIKEFNQTRDSRLQEITAARNAGCTLTNLCENPDCDNSDVLDLHYCEACHVSKYCSKLCQRIHRPIHEVSCIRRAEKVFKTLSIR